MTTRTILIPLLLGLLAGTQATAREFTKSELEAWFKSDFDGSPEQFHRKKTKINGGKLTFLQNGESKSVMHSHNVITITRNSIDTGWVKLQQCYFNLDAFPRVQAMFKYRWFRNLRVLSSSGIGKKWVKGKSIQMANVQQGATLCTSSEIRVFYQNPDKTFSLVNGPFSRRFLDGYFPMRVTVEVNFPGEKLKYLRSIPNKQPGLNITSNTNKVALNALFEGKMNTELRFEERKETAKK